MDGNTAYGIRQPAVHSGNVSTGFAQRLSKYGASPQLLRKVEEVTEDQLTTRSPAAVDRWSWRLPRTAVAIVLGVMIAALLLAAQVMLATVLSPALFMATVCGSSIVAGIAGYHLFLWATSKQEKARAIALQQALQQAPRAPLRTPDAASAEFTRLIAELRRKLPAFVRAMVPAEPQFELSRDDATGQFRLRIARDGEVIASSETSYPTREAALDGLDDLRRSVVAATIRNALFGDNPPEDLTGTGPGRFEVFPDAAGRFHVQLRTASGKVIAWSKSYPSREAALAGLDDLHRSLDAAYEGWPGG